jgi:hypothetical protein
MAGRRAGRWQRRRVKPGGEIPARLGRPAPHPASAARDGKRCRKVSATETGGVSRRYMILPKGETASNAALQTQPARLPWKESWAKLSTIHEWRVAC